MNISLDTAIDVSTGLYLGFISISGLMLRNPRACTPSKTPQCRPTTSTTNDEVFQSTSTDEVVCQPCSPDSTKSKVCPISVCARSNLKLAVATGFVASGLYLYRGLRT